MNTEGLKNELKEKIAECNRLYDLLAKRPFEINCQLDLVTYDDHKRHAVMIKENIDKGNEFYVNGNKDGGVITVRPFAYDIDNYDRFFGLVVNVISCKSVKVNQFVEFGSYDLYDNPKMPNERVFFLN